MRNEPDVKAGPLPAIAGVLVIVAVMGSLWWKTREEPATAPAVAQVAPAAPAPAPARAVPAAERDFLAFASREAPASLPPDHGYTADGLRKLAAALATSGGNLLWRDRAKRLEAMAAELEKDAASLDHADKAREAFLETADWLGDPGVKAAGEAIRPDQPLSQQSAQVEAFFRAVAARLQQNRA